MNLYSAFIQSVEAYGNHTALQWEGGSLTYQQLREKTDSVGVSLKKLTGTTQQIIAILNPNVADFFYGLFGVLGAGHIAAPINPLLNPEETAVLLRHCETKFLLTDSLLQEKAKQAIKLAGKEIQLLSIPRLLEEEIPQATLPVHLPSQDSLSMILYTSGTTGDPKGVMLSHKNIYDNTDSLSKMLRFYSKDTFLCCLPLFHTFAMTVIVFSALIKGARIILYPQFNPQKILEDFVKESSIVIAAVPPMLHMLARLAPEGFAEQHNLRIVASGGGPLPVDVAHAFSAKFNHAILEGYGLTETSPVVSFNPIEKYKLGTVGPPIAGVEVEIRDEQGQSVPTGVVGELCVRGSIVMKGYFKNEEATQNAFWKNGWLRTGDLAQLDEDGYIQIVGRLKDVIVSGGENIYPREIEETLLRHPGVAEAAVVAKPHTLRTEVPHAFVVIAEPANEPVTETILRKFCRQHLAEYKIPDGFTFLETMPRTPKGTVEKKELTQQLNPQKP